MDWRLFIAKRLYKEKKNGQEVSKPAVRIAVLGIAVGLAVMIVSIAIVVGFKHQVRDKVVGLGADLVITNFDAQKSFETTPVAFSDSVCQTLNKLPQVTKVQRYATKPGMIMTDDNFQGMVVKGIGQEYDIDFLKRHLVAGEIPMFTDSVASNQVLVSRKIADKLKLHLGDKLYTYYIEGEQVRARRLKIAGIYQTNFAAYDDLFLVTDLYTILRLNKWHKDQCSGLEIRLKEKGDLDHVKSFLLNTLDGQKDCYGHTYYSQTIEEKNPQLFAWLDLLDMNVWVILVLMTGVAGFTMISGLLIIILERTNMIGVLKAMGTCNLQIRKIFLLFGVFLIGKGMLYGNIIGLFVCFLQSQLHLFRLDPTIYYIDSVPIEFHFQYFILLNVATFAVSVLMLIAPSYLITRIHPVKAIRFE